MKKLLLACFLVTLSALSYAQQIVVMVPPFELVSGVSRAEADTITRLFLGKLSQARVVTVVNTANLKQRMDAMKWEMSDWSSDEKKARLNEGINADYLIIGTISKLGSNIIVDATLEDTNHFNVVGNTDISMKSVDEAYEKIDPLVDRMVASMTGGKASPAAPVTRPGTIPEGFVRIQGGTFTMGSPSSEVNRSDSEAQHRVTVSAFYMGQYEVTQAEYETVIGSNPSSFKGGSLPVENVSWFDAVFYCNQRSAREGLSPAYTINGENVTWNRNANGYRLPTEAEWEYACRAGTTTPFSTGYNISTSQANYNGNYPYANNPKGSYREKTTNVGSFASNSWGLYDMHGNVWEWCWDWYGGYSMADQTDPSGAASGPHRVLRGGGWSYLAQYLRSANRGSLTPSGRSYSIGFRVVRP